MTEKKFRCIGLSIGALALLLLSVPTILIFFIEIPEVLFVTLNTIGLLLVTLYVVLTIGINISIHAVKGEKTSYKKKVDAYVWLLFSVAVAFQLVNLMFVHFE